MNSYHLKISISKSENISPYKKDPVPNKEWAVFRDKYVLFYIKYNIKIYSDFGCTLYADQATPSL